MGFDMARDSAEVQAGDCDRRADTTSSPPSQAPLRALVVEDDPINQRVLCAILKRIGYTPIAAGDGQAGLEQFKNSTPLDVVLMDLQMPIMDGFESTQQMRLWEQQRGLARVPIIAVTAATLDEYSHHAFAAGMDEFLTKPVSPELLRETLARFVRR